MLNQLVQTLNETLQKSLYLTGPHISSADVAVWSLLSPDGTLTGSHDIENVSIWYKTISELAEVKVFVFFSCVNQPANMLNITSFV